MESEILPSTRFYKCDCGWSGFDPRSCFCPFCGSNYKRCPKCGKTVIPTDPWR